MTRCRIQADGLTTGHDDLVLHTKHVIDSRPHMTRCCIQADCMAHERADAGVERVQAEGQRPHLPLPQHPGISIHLFNRPGSYFDSTPAPRPTMWSKSGLNQHPSPPRMPPLLSLTRQTH
jgi:hypothetical protein